MYEIDSEDRNYYVTEQATGLRVAVFRTLQEAKSLCNTLCMGAGFEGLTPEFFCYGITQKKRS